MCQSSHGGKGAALIFYLDPRQAEPYVVGAAVTATIKEISQTKQAVRAKQMMPYTLSRKGYASEHKWAAKFLTGKNFFFCGNVEDEAKKLVQD